VKDLAKTQKDKFDKYASKQNKTNLENADTKNADKDLVEDNALDQWVEEEFEKYLLKLGQDNAIGTVNKIKTGNMAALQNDFNTYIQNFFADKAEFSQYMNLLKNAEIKDALQPFTFELEALSQEVMDMLNTEPKESETGDQDGTVDEEGNVLHNDLGTSGKG